MRGNLNLVIRKIPFLKLFIAFIAGITLQWYADPNESIYLFSFTAGISILVSMFFIPRFDRLRFSILALVAASMIFFSLGGSAARKKDRRNDPRWIGNIYMVNDAVCVSLDEPPVEKAKTWKAKAKIHYIIRNR